MSAANRAQASAASEQHNQENMLSRLRGSLKARAPSNENQENQPPKQAANRTVLGPLHNNTRVKTQNQRAAKQVGLANDAKWLAQLELLMTVVDGVPLSVLEATTSLVSNLS